MEHFFVYYNIIGTCTNTINTDILWKFTTIIPLTWLYKFKMTRHNTNKSLLNYSLKLVPQLCINFFLDSLYLLVVLNGMSSHWYIPNIGWLIPNRNLRGILENTSRKIEEAFITTSRNCKDMILKKHLIVRVQIAPSKKIGEKLIDEEDPIELKNLIPRNFWWVVELTLKKLKGPMKIPWPTQRRIEWVIQCKLVFWIDILYASPYKWKCGI